VSCVARSGGGVQERAEKWENLLAAVARSITSACRLQGLNPFLDFVEYHLRSARKFSRKHDGLV
jgi:hypothetical protein